MIGTMPGPTTETTTIRMMMSGKLIQASTTRCTTMSKRPPKYPVVIPIRIEIAVASPAPAKPMTTDSCAP